MAHALPIDSRELTADWFSGALTAATPGARVLTATTSPGMEGIASKLLFELTYNAAGQAAGLPDRVCVKGGFNPNREMVFSLLAGEARFYRDYAGMVLSGRPTAYFAEIDEAAQQAIVVMEDLTQANAEFCTYDRPLDVDTAAAIVVTLAELHAQWWLADSVLNDPALGENPARNLVATFLSKENWNMRANTPRWDRVPEPFRDRDRVIGAIAAMWDMDRTRPMTFTHGDPHIGNIYRVGGVPMLLDWQCSYRAPGINDVGFFFVGAMTIEHRRQHEQALLELYCAELRARGVQDFSIDQAWLGYRQRLMHGWANFLTPGDIQGEGYNGTVGERFAIAALDHDTLGALGL